MLMDDEEELKVEEHLPIAIGGQDHPGVEIQVVGGAAQASQPVSGQSAAAAAQSNQPAEMCKLCYENECDAAFIPCGHVTACIKCAGRC